MKLIGIGGVIYAQILKVGLIKAWRFSYILQQIQTKRPGSFMLHNTDIDKHLNCNIIYIPFTRNELDAKTLTDINNFAISNANIGKDYIVLYHGECNLSFLSENSKIYILAHGLDVKPNYKWCVTITDDNLPFDLVKNLPFWDWAYSITGGKSAISIDTVALRMIADGLLESDNLNIKLYFCDVNDKADIIAKRFINNFKDDNKNFKVDYYPNHILHDVKEFKGNTHKWATDSNTGNIVRTSSIKHSLFSKKPSNEKNYPEERKFTNCTCI